MKTHHCAAAESSIPSNFLSSLKPTVITNTVTGFVENSVVGTVSENHGKSQMFASVTFTSSNDIGKKFKNSQKLPQNFICLESLEKRPE